jgi:hypothetical protein
VNELIKLFDEIGRLPEASFKASAPPSQRSRELSLLDSVLPITRISKEVVRACRKDGPRITMHYQIRNGSFRDVRITYNQDTGDIVMIVDGKEVTAPRTKSELADALTQLIQGVGS